MMQAFLSISTCRPPMLSGHLVSTNDCCYLLEFAVIHVQFECLNIQQSCGLLSCHDEL